jgi:pimeloyl-ACP methyl ester carboxylesterase
MATTVVLVHGAWADGSSWAKVIPLLRAAGLEPVAVQMPLTSLADDAAVAKRALALAASPVLMVGHSYGGCVITEAGDDSKVVGLVYVAAFAPDVGQSAGSLGDLVPQSPVGAQMRPDSNGFIKLTTKGIEEDFAPDLSKDERETMAATQGPTHVKSLGGIASIAAWEGRPTWYVRASSDRTIPPELQHLMATKIGATVTNVDSSHVPMLSHPQVVAEVIIAAAGSLAK